MTSSTKIRLAPDVEAIALEICRRRGLGGVRQAVEAVMRVFGEHYLDCECQHPRTVGGATAPSSMPPNADGNSAMAELGF